MFDSFKFSERSFLKYTLPTVEHDAGIYCYVLRIEAYYPEKKLF